MFADRFSLVTDDDNMYVRTFALVTDDDNMYVRTFVAEAHAGEP